MTFYTVVFPMELLPTERPREDPAMELQKREDAGKTVFVIKTVLGKTVLYHMSLTSIYNYLIRRELLNFGSVVGRIGVPSPAAPSGGMS